MELGKFTLVISFVVLILNCFSIQSSTYLTGIPSLSIPIAYNYISINNSITTPTTIVIDPGHGGKDRGCSHSQHEEKQITLKIAKKLGRLLEQSNKNLKVKYTRTQDEFVTLKDRASLANNIKADLFISVHTNSLYDKSVRGFETYVFGNSPENNEQLSHIENLIIAEENLTTNTNISELILGNISKTITTEESIALAEHIDHQLDKLPIIKNRGLKQAKFKVLKYTEMPSVLLELGFLTNQKDYQLLNSEEGQNRLIEKIASGIIDYLAKD